MRILSKSKLLAFRQCPKRLWLEIHRPELREDSAASQASFATGHLVGEIARRLYDPSGKGRLVDISGEGVAAAIARSRELLDSPAPIFEAGFSADGARAFADVMLPLRRGGRRVWRMIEVKSSASLKGYYREDAAIQSFVVRRSGVPLHALALAHIDSSWTYPGGGEYQGLLTEIDLTEEAAARDAEVAAWISVAQTVAAKRKEPERKTGKHCNEPYECGFLAYCSSCVEPARYPVAWLPAIQTKALKGLIENQGIADLRDIPDDLLNERQLRVKACTLAGKTYFDAANAARDLAAYGLPAYFMDFETTQLAVPIWKGTRPYQQVPFQYSVHRLSRTGKLDHRVFLDISGNDPSRGFAESLLADCGERGPVFGYNIPFERSRLEELAGRFPRMRKPLLALAERLVDLRPVAEQRFYDPRQRGRWGLKDVLPAVAPDADHANLDGVKAGGMAMEAYREATSPDTTAARKAKLRRELLDYCERDTYGLVRLWQYLAGRDDLEL
jgi:hypothetical protein